MPKDFDEMSISDFFAREDAAEKANQGKDRVSELEAQLAALNAQIKTLTSAGPAPELDEFDYPEAPELVELSFEGLPDMYSEPDKYQQAIARRIQENSLVNQKIQRDYEREIARIDSVKANQGAAIWNEFTELHPELKDYADQVSFVAEKIAYDKQAQGIDSRAYIFRNKAQFFDEVVEGLNKFMPGLAKGGEAADGTTVEAGDTSRTDGVFGGAFSPFPVGEPGAGPGKGEQGKGDMVKDMQAIQRKSGFF